MERELKRHIDACVFDAYGTLLDLNGALAPAAASLGDRASELLTLRRAKQLEYSAHGSDAAGAAKVGLHVIWINRGGAPRDRLAVDLAAEVATLADVAGVLWVSSL